MSLDEQRNDIYISFLATDDMGIELYQYHEVCRKLGTAIAVGRRRYFVVSVGHVELAPEVKIARLGVSRPLRPRPDYPRELSTAAEVLLLHKQRLHPAAYHKGKR